MHCRVSGSDIIRPFCLHRSKLQLATTDWWLWLFAAPTASARLDGRDERGAQQATAPLIRRRQLIGMDGLARPGRQERRVFFLEYALATLDPVNERRQLLFTCCNIAGNDWIVCCFSGTKSEMTEFNQGIFTPRLQSSSLT